MPKGKSKTPLTTQARRFNFKVMIVKSALNQLTKMCIEFGISGSYNITVIANKVLEAIEEEREIAKIKLKKSLDISRLVE